ncbi:MAG: hypothetical protein R3C52_01435 [Hyphomonadaceae bacterium]
MAGSDAAAPDLDLPLAVDLDGTLIRADMFAASMLRFVLSNPLNTFALAVWLLKGRANAKAKLAERLLVDPASLPWDERVLDWLKAERARGRRVVLATAWDGASAQAIADHAGVFDDVFASDGRVNLKSARKAEALARAFPEGFVYAGNEAADLKVWARAACAVVVNAAPELERQARARFEIERAFPRQQAAGSSLRRALNVRFRRLR